MKFGSAAPDTARSVVIRLANDTATSYWWQAMTRYAAHRLQDGSIQVKLLVSETTRSGIVQSRELGNLHRGVAGVEIAQISGG